MGTFAGPGTNSTATLVAFSLTLGASRQFLDGRARTGHGAVALGGGGGPGSRYGNPLLSFIVLAADEADHFVRES